MPGNSYTYRFNITGQEGTLWWHAHVQWLRATVYGALVIRPRGEWWNANPIDVEKATLATGGVANKSIAYTINGWPGDLYSCPSRRKTYLLRIINAALNTQMFLKIANHSMTIVAADAAYTNPYPTYVIVVGPGQTTDVLLTTNQSLGSYYMAVRAYISGTGRTLQQHHHRNPYLPEHHHHAAATSPGHAAFQRHPNRI
ncbi:unnamed protein product [Lactuca virosa]|uniref:laccase n=1 Tax=Lactuca virosa TaxID=75947 RepID=A0AAU9N7F2_9ASTR|nr:unnamed protein product [Lactuca virosa]